MKKQAKIPVPQNILDMLTKGKPLDNLVTLAPLILGVASVPIVTGGIDKAIGSAGEAYRRVKDRYTLDDKIDRLIEIHPEKLNDPKDRDKIKMYYLQLRQFSPEIAANDFAAAAYIRESLRLHEHTPFSMVQVLSGVAGGLAKKPKRDTITDITRDVAGVDYATLLGMGVG